MQHSITLTGINLYTRLSQSPYGAKWLATVLKEAGRRVRGAVAIPLRG